MLTTAEKDLLSSVVRETIREKGNPVLVTEIAASIHGSPLAEQIWRQHESLEYDSKISAFIETLPQIELVGQMELGLGSCYAYDKTLPVTRGGNWVSWSKIVEGRPVIPTPYRPLSSSERDTLILFLQNLIVKNGGKVLSARAGTECLTSPVTLKLRSRFSSFTNMLTALAPDITQVRDSNGVDYLISGKAPAEFAHSADLMVTPEENSDAYPEQIDVNSPEVADATREMFSFAFMGWANVLSKKLRAMTGFPGKDQKVWIGILSLALRRARESDKLFYHTVLIEGKVEHLCVFNTGLTDIAGHTVYAVLKENHVPGYQPWAMAELCYIGNPESAYSSVLESLLSSEPQSTSLIAARRQRLMRMVSTLYETYVNVQPTLEKLSGGGLPGSDTLSAIQLYLGQILELRSSGLLTVAGAEEENITISDLQLLVGKNPSLGYLEEMAESVYKVLNIISEVLRKILGVDVMDESYSIGECRQFFQSAGDAIRGGAGLEGYTEQYRFWINKLNSLVDFLWRGNKTALNDISAEFRQVPSIMNFISDTLSTETGTADELGVELRRAEDLVTLLEAQPDSGIENDGQNTAARETDAESAQAGEAEIDMSLFADEIDVGALRGGLSEEGSQPDPGAAPEAFSAPSTRQASGDDEETDGISGGTPASEEVFRRNLVDVCLSGEMEPEFYPLEFGNWEIGSDQPDAPVSSMKTAALDLLATPKTAAQRNIQNLTICVCNALRENKTELASALLYQIPRGAEMEMCLFLIQAQKILNHTIERVDLLYDAADHLSALLNAADRGHIQTAEISASVLTFLPFLCCRCLQIDAIRYLFEKLFPDGSAAWVSYAENGAAVEQVRELLFSGRADKDFREHAYEGSRFRTIMNQQNRDQNLSSLRGKGAVLKQLISSTSDHYKNARHVLFNLVNTEKSPRTASMFNSLLAGEQVGDALPFASDEEIVGYINEVQSKLFDARSSDITGPSREHILTRVRELNSAYQELLELTSDEITVTEDTRRWYTDLFKSLSNVRKLAERQVKSLSNEPLKAYLLSLFKWELWQAAAGQDTFELAVTVPYGWGSVWPLLEEDRRITALLELSGTDTKLETLALSRSVTLEKPDNSALIHAAERLRQRCEAAAMRLCDLKWANAVDRHEYQSLLDSLSRNQGWLRRYQDTLSRDKADAVDLCPLVRYEADIWYGEQRVGSYIRRMADGIIDSFEKRTCELPDSEEKRALREEIEAAVTSGHVRELTERFSDLMSDQIMKLKEEASSASLFFRKDILGEIYLSVRDESWRKAALKGIELVSREMREKLGYTSFVPSPREVTAVGEALGALEEYSRGKEDSSTRLRNLRGKEHVINTFFRFLGFTEPEVEIAGETIWLTFGAQDRTVCPLPGLVHGIMFGEGSDRHLRVRYAVEVMQDINHVSRMLTTVQPVVGDEFTVLLCPFAINFNRRRELLALSRRTDGNHAFFLLDKCFIRFAMYFSQRDRLKVFYACCTHLMQLLPYNVNTPTEPGGGIFYGRSREIDRIIRTAGASVIYGGRRLGKTSIMRELEYRWSNQSVHNLVVYLDLKNANNEHPENVLWYLIARSLANRIRGLEAYRVRGLPGIEEIRKDAQNIIQILTEYLETEDGRLLLLIDESDDLIFRDTVRQRERSGDGSRISELIRLLNRNPARVKVVIAGLDRVTRFVRNLNAYAMPMDPNWEAFQHFNNPIALKPLVGGDMQNAFDLVDIPFKIMGYRMERRSILYILRVCCFRPNLIQNYCYYLLNSIHGNREIVSTGESLFLEIPHEQVVGLYEGQSGNTEFHRSQWEQSIRIPLNVGVTLVYAPVAYAVAVMSYRKSITGMFTGFSASEILAEILSYNQAFADNTASATDYITTILNDLEIMGVLRTTRRNDTTYYALFSNYMLRMLGDERSIEAELIKNLEAYISENKKTSEELREMYADRFTMEMGADFTPLTIDQMESLRKLLEGDGCAVVVGSEMLRLESVPDMLRKMRLQGKEHDVVSMSGEEFDHLDLEELFDLSVGGSTPLLVIRKGWTWKHIERTRQKHRENADVMVVMLADSDLCRSEATMLDNIPWEYVIHMTRLERSFRNGWFERMLEQEPVRFGKDDTETERREAVDKIGSVIYDWPLLAWELRSLFQKTGDAGVSEVLRQYQRILRENAKEYWAKMGLNRIQWEVWEIISQFSRVRECIEYAETEDIPPDKVLEALHYLSHMNVIDMNYTRESDNVIDGYYRVDLCAKFLESEMREK